MLTARTTRRRLAGSFFFDTDVQVEQQETDTGAEVMHESPDQASQNQPWPAAGKHRLECSEAFRKSRLAPNSQSITGRQRNNRHR
jgi:hypothetical protein